MTEGLKESLRRVLSHTASEALKARKCGNIDRAKKLSMTFKILSKEYDRIRSQEKEKSND